LDIKGKKMTKENILTYLHNHKAELSSKYNVSKIAIFGSYARDEATPDSDVDILVEMPSSFKDFFHLKSYLEKGLNKKVDLGTFDNVRAFVNNRIQKDLIYV
jgi:predicted nucleotidyltransferase